MTEIFTWLFDFVENIYFLLNSFAFDLFGVTVSLSDIFIGFIIFNMITLVVWRGAKG